MDCSINSLEFVRNHVRVNSEHFVNSPLGMSSDVGERFSRHPHRHSTLEQIEGCVKVASSCVRYAARIDCCRLRQTQRPVNTGSTRVGSRVSAMSSRRTHSYQFRLDATHQPYARSCLSQPPKPRSLLQFRDSASTKCKHTIQNRDGRLVHLLSCICLA